MPDGVKIQIDAPGLQKLSDRMLQNPKKVIAAMGEAIDESAKILEAESKKAITTGPNRAIDTGRLRSELVPRELDKRKLRATLYPIVHYAVYVHEGTRFMRPRPFFETAKQTATPLIQEVFKARINEALN